MKLVFSILLIIFLGLTTSVLAQVGLPNPLGSVTDLNTLITNISNAIKLIVAPIAVIMYIWAGILYLTSAGNPSKIEKANKAAFYATIGLGIALAGIGIANLVYWVITGTTIP